MNGNHVLQPSFEDQDDFQDASRGFIGKREPCILRDDKGREVWNNDVYSFLQGDCPPTVNPKLWRQSKITSIQGLFEVVPGVYQVRGFDLANLTVIEGRTGIIVVDPLISVECAREALSLYRQHRGERKVLGVIYSHPHIDHFGGAPGVLDNTHDNVPIIAPEGFIEEAVSENIFCGPAMSRRAAFMYGALLPKQPEGQVGCGLAMAISTGESTLVPPSTLITETGQEMNVDGVRLIFQMVPETEAPVELNFYLPDHETLYISECAGHGLHNITTLRGALVRDAKKWSQHLDETAALFGKKSKALCSGHLWPTWGQDRITRFIYEQRDLYAYLHDQTIRMMNLGMNGTEIAEVMTLPPRLQTAWHTVGYYGSISHNVKGIYQRYMTWFDGNPANLWPHTPVEEGKRYVECFGGVQELIKKAEKFVADGDLRFAATLLDHAVNAEPDNQAATDSLAAIFQKLGFGAENATWRNFFLTRAMELKSGRGGSSNGGMPPMPLNALGSVEDWLGSLSIQLDGPKAAEESLVAFIRDPELGEAWKVTLSNGALTYRKASEDECEAPVDDSSLLLQVTKKELLEVLRGNIPMARNKVVKGNSDGICRLLSLCSIKTIGEKDSPSRL